MTISSADPAAGVESESKDCPAQEPRAESMEGWWLYLLACRDGRTYAGIATDVHARFRKHQTGKGARFTRANPPVEILGMRRFDSRSAALKAEHALKQLPLPEKLAWARCFAPVSA